MRYELFQACSLWSTEGTSDKVYDLQLMPHPTNPALASVYAQYGRRGAPTLARRVVVENVAASAAVNAYHEKRDEKLSKGYRAVALARESAVQSERMAEERAAHVRTQFDGTRYPWPSELRDMFSEVLEALGFSQNVQWGGTSPESIVALMLADVSEGLPEGFPELQASITNNAGIVPLHELEGQLFSQLSPELAAVEASVPDREKARRALRDALETLL